MRPSGRKGNSKLNPKDAKQNTPAGKDKGKAPLKDLNSQAKGSG